MLGLFGHQTMSLVATLSSPDDPKWHFDPLMRVVARTRQGNRLQPTTCRWATLQVRAEVVKSDHKAKEHSGGPPKRHRFFHAGGAVMSPQR